MGIFVVTSSPIRASVMDQALEDLTKDVVDIFGNVVAEFDHIEVDEQGRIFVVRRVCNLPPASQDNPHRGTIIRGGPVACCH
jgi:hypothetical protein